MPEPSTEKPLRELERRDPEAFARWLDNDYSQHPELDTPRAWFAA